MRKNKVLWGILLLGGAGLAMAFPEQTASGAEVGLELCLNRVIPSLFPMMVISVMAVESGLANTIGNRLAPVSERLFGLPGQAAAALLLSLMGGYPAGAKAVVGLYESGAVTREQAGRMALFCFCAGPAFLIGMVGGVTGSPVGGWLLMAVQAVAVCVTGILVCRIKPLASQERFFSTAVTRDKGASEIIVASVRKSADAMLQVCLYVVIFSAVRNLTEAVGATDIIVSALTSAGLSRQTAQAVLPVLFEVTGGCISAARAGLPMIAFAVGFGGLSVQTQVLAITEKLNVNKPAFMLARLFQGTLSAVLTAAAMRFMPESVSVSADFSAVRLSGSPEGAVMLMVMCVMFVLCVPSPDGCPAAEKQKRGQGEPVL